MATAPSISPNEDESKPYALDQQQLNSIGYFNIDKLQDFKSKLEEAMAKVPTKTRAGYWEQQRVEYLILKAKVDERIAAINALRHPVHINENINPDNNDRRTKVAKITGDGSANQEDDEMDGDDGTDGDTTTDLGPIQKQKERALQQLGSFKAAPEETDKCSSIKDAIIHQGRVKPVFHNLFLPDTFLNNPRSFEEVKAGDVDEDRTLELENRATNLNEVVNNISGNGAKVIIDKFASRWIFDSAFSVFAVELVNTDAVMLGEGIECTTFTAIPTDINSGFISSDLLTRPESRGVVSDVFHRFAKEVGMGSVAAITGSPGIGKSWTLFYALQQALLYDGATVLFFFQKLSIAVLYLRRNNRMYAWFSDIRNSADSRLFERFDVLVLLDPEEATKGGANYNLGRMKLLFAASNNKGHFTNSAEKENGRMRAFLGPPRDSELDIILRSIDPTLTQDVIDERKKNVGNLIRYILDQEKYLDRRSGIQKAVEDCVGDKKLCEKVFRNDGMSDGSNTVPGTIFQVLPTRPTSPTTVGYDGQNVNYRERVVLALNDHVRNAILCADRQVTLSYWGKIDDHEYVKKG